jgi:hypothetical protein
MQTIKLCACVAFCYELDLAAVRPDQPQLPGLRIVRARFSIHIFVVIRCHLRPSADCFFHFQRPQASQKAFSNLAGCSGPFHWGLTWIFRLQHAAAAAGLRLRNPRADHDLDLPNVALAQAPQLAQFLSHLMPEGIAGGDAVDLVFEDAVKPCDHAEVVACPQARCAPRRCIRSATVRTRCFCTKLIFGDSKRSNSPEWITPAVHLASQPTRSRNRLRLNDLIGYAVHDQHLVLHFHVHVITQFRYLRENRRW